MEVKSVAYCLRNVKLSEKKLELVAEVDFGEKVDETTLKGLQAVMDAVKELRGDAELLYRDNRWRFRVYKPAGAERAPAKALRKEKVEKAKVMKKPKPPREFLVETVKSLVSKDKSLVQKPKEVSKVLKERSGNKGYTRRIPLRFVEALLKKLSSEGKPQ